jgi:hypothetical protein
MTYNYQSEYIDYMMLKISTLDLKHLDIVLESLSKIKKEDPSEETIKKLQPIHYHYYKTHKLNFLDYWNFKRCKELGLEIK